MIKKTVAVTASPGPEAKKKPPRFSTTGLPKEEKPARK
jgi:hypothetical protein